MRVRILLKKRGFSVALRAELKPIHCSCKATFYVVPHTRKLSCPLQRAIGDGSAWPRSAALRRSCRFGSQLVSGYHMPIVFNSLMIQESARPVR